VRQITALLLGGCCLGHGGIGEASDFFRCGSAGFSATRDGSGLDGLRLRADRWVVEPAEVDTVRSSFFDDARLFPAGSATLDCALLMRDIPATWTAFQPAFPASLTTASRQSARADQEYGTLE
jgi:hypothetical protein